MIPTLYDNFKHWAEKGSVYIISDPHFNDEDCKSMNPNWLDPNIYIRAINKIVHKSDTLICLGDCGDLSYIQQLKAGHKVLIMGNHDVGATKFTRQIIKKTYESPRDASIVQMIEDINIEYPGYLIKFDPIDDLTNFSKDVFRYDVSLDNRLFDEVYTGPLFISDQILLSHEPIYGMQFCVNIHGHVHNGEYEYTDEYGCKHLNLAADVVNWQVKDLNKLIKAGLISDIPTIHRLVIDKKIYN